MDQAEVEAERLAETPLAAQHVAAGARMVPFAGYRMPVQYPTGIIAEHRWTRAHAGLFDVSHMGQLVLSGPDHETIARAIETLVPADIRNLAPGRQRYTQILNEEGGIVDDLMVGRPTDPGRQGELLLVVNADTREADFRLIEAALPDGIRLERRDRALLALQGPESAAVMSDLMPAIADLAFMRVAAFDLPVGRAEIGRSGYTGEDGFEISVAAEHALDLWSLLINDERVKPIGLGARDSLRLEAGLPLYGHDINQETSPVEAALAWSIGRRRREAGDFPGHLRIARELAEGPLRRRVGILVDGRAPAREHADIVDEAGELIGKVTSGGFGPSVEAPVAMGYVVPDFARPGTPVGLMVRGRRLAGHVTRMPFHPHRYKR